MELRTTFDIEPSAVKITYNDPVLFVGSCFATSIGSHFEEGKMPVLINPSGTVYNPVSVYNTLNTITDGRGYTTDDLYNNNGIWLSFNHYTDFSSEDVDSLLARINSVAERSRNFISSARFLFITFGTARVYRWKNTGKIVSNCHKMPSSMFTDELLTPSEIVSLWDMELTKLRSLFPDLKVVFTISPVRHWKNGAHGNQVSKSVLFVAVEELMGHPSGPAYFPAYELLMDDLRDYRFYDDDMLHPSESAVKYVWQRFSDCYLDSRTAELRNEIIKVTRACKHRLTSTLESKKQEFARSMIERIRVIESKIPSVDLSAEKDWFNRLLG